MSRSRKLEAPADLRATVFEHGGEELVVFGYPVDAEEPDDPLVLLAEHLTPAQAEVAALALAGHSNREIARRRSGPVRGRASTQPQGRRDVGRDALPDQDLLGVRRVDLPLAAGEREGASAGAAIERADAEHVGATSQLEALRERPRGDVPDLTRKRGHGVEVGVALEGRGRELGPAREPLALVDPVEARALKRPGSKRVGRRGIDEVAGRPEPAAQHGLARLDELTHPVVVGLSDAVRRLNQIENIEDLLHANSRMRVCQRSPGQTAALAEAIDRYRAVRGIERVDLLGESWGGAIASQLAAEPERVRSCVIVSAAYRTPTPTLDAAARAPGQRAMLDGIPDGYLPIGLEIWGPLLAPCPPTVREWAIADQVGYARARRSTPSSICPTSIPPSRGSPGS